MKKSRRTLFAAILYLFSVFSLNHCGQEDSKTQDRQDSTLDKGTLDENTKAQPQSCLDSFKEQIAPAFDTTCTTCHTSTSMGGKALIKEDHSQNRTQLLIAMANKDFASSTQLVEFLSSGGSHAGGPMISNLPEQNINLWLAQEKSCL